MKGGGDSRYTVAQLLVFSILLGINSVKSQNGPIPLSGIGIPLPSLKGGQASSQGQSSTKYTVILEDNNDGNVGIALPTLDPTIGGNNPFDNNARHPTQGARGPGSLQHIKEPSQDKSVSDLINHPVVLKTIQKETRADKIVKVDSIISAHKQVVSGQLTYLDLKVVKTTCPLGGFEKHCPVDTSEDPYVCEVAIWQRAWLNQTKTINEKTKCAEVEDDNDFKNWNKGNGGLRRMSSEIDLKQVPHHLDEHQVALEAYDYVDRGSESKFKGQMIDFQFGEVKHDPRLNLTLIEVKVEYGFTLCLKFPKRKVDDRVCPVDRNRTNYICSVKVISDPQLTTNLKVKPNDDDDIDCKKKEPVTEELVVPVQAVCMGCPQSISLNDPALLPMAEFAVMEYDKTSGDDELHKMVRLHKARTQVVNGIKYFLTIELADTDCRKPLSAVNMNRSLCNIDRTDETDICEIVIHEQPWQKSRELVSARCRDSFSSDAFIVPSHGFFESQSSSLSPGSHSGLSGSNPLHSTSLTADLSPVMRESVNFLLAEINLREVDDRDDGLYKILNILKASSVNEPIGLVDIIVLKLGETVCRPGDSSVNCNLKFGEEPEICSGKVQRESSADGRTNRILVSLKCDDDLDEHFDLTVNPATSPFLLANRPFFTANSGSLGLPGGPLQQPNNSTTTMEIAHFVVDQFNLQNDDDEIYKLGKVLSSYSQLSATVRYTIEIELLETDCKKYQPVLDISKCPVDLSEDPEVCQAEVSVSFSNDGSAMNAKKLLRMFCDERKDYFVKKLAGDAHLQISQTHPATNVDVNDNKIQILGKKIADEFDLRSDEDHIFVLFKILNAKSLTTGLSHQLRVELAETVCPKYKQKIDKSRCVVDIGEEHKLCDALVTEKPWRNDYDVTQLRCFERDDSVEDDESREVLYPQVHPSAHARPKFVQSRYRVRQHSQESLESNEQYYQVGGEIRNQQSREDDSHEFHRFQRRSQRRFEDDDDDERDSDRRTERDSRSNERPNFRFRSTDGRNGGSRRGGRGSNGGLFLSNGGRRDQFQSHEGVSRFQSDEDRFDSNESSRRLRVGRKKRSKISPMMFGGSSSADLNDPEVHKVAAFGVEQMDLTSTDKRLRKSEEILEASKQLVAGILWSIKSKVTFTKCLKGDKVDLDSCEFDRSESSQICDMKIWLQPWKKFEKLKESHCSPIQS